VPASLTLAGNASDMTAVWFFSSELAVVWVFCGGMVVYALELFVTSGGLSPARSRIRWGIPDHGFNPFCSGSCLCSAD